MRSPAAAGICLFFSTLSAAADVRFDRDIQPLLAKHCLACHNSTTRQGGLDLSSHEKLMRGGDRGAAVVPGDPKQSLLYAYITHQRQPGMPMGAAKLPEPSLAAVAEWIKAGAPAAARAAVRSDHWSFQKPARPPLPSSPAAHPIDAFLDAARARHSLPPLGPASRQTLLRRLSLDLTGLPPTPAEIAAFLADSSPTAYEKVVDRLLASSAYAERWGRHWMDVWRYSDWYGSGASEVRNSQRHIWQWRDWIIDSLAAGKPYDRMVQEMLAGDELAPTDPATLRATGFLARNWFRFNRNVWLVDTIESTSAAFLGVTLKCARCHDHKYDPFSQEDYYRFRAFFEPHDVRIDRIAGQPDRVKAGLPRVYDSEAKPALPDSEGGINLLPQIFDKTYLFIRGDENDPDRSRAIDPATPPVLGGPPLKIQPVELPLAAFYPDLRDFVGPDLLAAARANIHAIEKRLAKNREALEQARREAAQPPAEPAGPPLDFDKQIKPLFVEKCAACHLGRNSKGGLSLLSVSAIQAGGKSGPAVVAGRSAESLLIRLLREQRMPLNAPPLAANDIALLAQWIDRLPRKKPAELLKELPFEIAAGERELRAAHAALKALDARIQAERALYASPPSPNRESLAEAARLAERDANILKSEEQVFRAQQRLSDAVAAPASTDEERKARDRNVSAAKRSLDLAVEALAKPADAYSPLGPVHPKVSTGRRLALARWITSRENPLTARVAVNHMWLRHFGQPLVSSVVDFGKNGRAPAHPQLLDWLAVEFMDSGWSMKHMHRLMVTSAAYRRESGVARADHPNLKADANNVWYWRMNPRRLEAEAIRDSVLAAAGSLDRTMHGPELHEENQQDVPRRSLYFRITPSAQMEFLKVFDGADPTACYRRSESIMPQQALALANSTLSLEQARILETKLRPAPDFLAAAYLTVLGRDPSPTERTQSQAYLASFADAAAARASLIHVLFNRNEFVTIR